MVLGKLAIRNKIREYEINHNKITFRQPFQIISLSIVQRKAAHTWPLVASRKKLMVRATKMSAKMSLHSGVRKMFPF